MKPFLLFALILAILPIGLMAQGASIGGVIRDPSGLPVADAKITISNKETGFERSLTSNKSGGYAVASLRPGTYMVAVELEGFQREESTVTVEVAQNVLHDYKLQVGTLASTVKVESRGDEVNAVNASVSTMVTHKMIAELPLNGRSFNTLVELSAGAVTVQASEQSRGQYAVNGSRSDANSYTIDGVSANLGVGSAQKIGQGGSGANLGGNALGGANNMASIDALQEFRIQTSTYAPEYGRNPGAQVSVVTRSGTNQFHGTLFDYLRNEKMDANDWFANRNGVRRAPLRQNDFGGVLGGPIVRNRTFFFFSYEGLRLRLPLVATTDVPSLAFRQSASAVLQPYLNLYPLPTGPAAIDAKTGKLNGFAPAVASFSNPAGMDATSMRVDHSLSSRLQLFGRYNYAPSSTSSRGSGTALNVSQIFDDGMQTATAGLLWIASPTITNDLRANYSTATGIRRYAMDSYGGATPMANSALFPSGFGPANAVVVLRITAGASAGEYLGNLASVRNQQYNFVDTLSWVKGKHQMKFGLDFRNVKTNDYPANFQDVAAFSDTGAITPSVGTVVSGSAASSILTHYLNGEMKFRSFSLYAQDTWRAGSRLTLTYGLRWEFNPTPFSDRGALIALTSVDNPASLAPADGPLYKTTYANFAPRVGLAYQFSKDSPWMTVVRGGFGMFYDTANGQASNALMAPPFSASTTIVNAPYPSAVHNAVLPISGQPPFGGTFYGTDPNLKLPRTFQWNVALEQSLGRKQSLTATYVGAAGRRLIEQDQYGVLNAAFPGTTYINTNYSYSNYSGLQLQFQRRLSAGLQILSTYTYSHALDNDSNDGSAVVLGTGFSRSLNYGNADFDVRHVFTALATYDAPTPHWGGLLARAILGHWSIDPIFRAHSAPPVDVVASKTVSGVLYSTRVNVTPGVPLYVANTTAPGGVQFNSAAFSVPSALVQGAFGRNVLRGFSFAQVDLSVHRKFVITERVGLTFQADSFNISNHPNFGNPGGAFTTASTFGLSTAMLGKSLNATSAGGVSPLYQIGGPRSTQLALKLVF